jgi:pilus assembly protein FimV
VIITVLPVQAGTIVPMASSFRALALLAFAPACALAADLGRLTVLSGVGEPLRAEIEILSVQPREGASLAARIPPLDVFWRANLEPPPLLDRLRARVERRPKGRYVVTLSSTTPVDSPFVQILVELSSATGRVVREYPFLLEESRVASPGSPIATGPSVPDRRAPALTADGTYVVEPGDTLAAIARATRVPDATVEQTVVALYQANESAFIGGNMNRLPAGTVLALPPAGVAAAIEPGEARRVIRAHRAALPRSARGPGGAGTATGDGLPSTKPVGTAGPLRPASGDQLRLTRPRESGSASGSADSAHGDDIVALQRALAEAQERIALLQRDLEDVRRLLALRREQLVSVDPPERSPAELPVRIPGDAAAAERYSAGASENGTLRDLVHQHGAWLLATFLAGFALWVVMPVKTTRAWLKRRRRRERAMLRAALDRPRTPRRAAATYYARLL